MDAVQKSLVGRRKLLAISPVDTIQLVGPDERLVLYVPTPTADVREMLRLSHLALALPEFVLCSLEIGDVLRGAVQANRISILVANDLTVRVEKPDLTIRSDYAPV